MSERLERWKAYAERAENHAAVMAQECETERNRNYELEFEIDLLRKELDEVIDMLRKERRVSELLRKQLEQDAI